MAVEHRDHRELKINPEGTDDGTLPRTFRLEVWAARQQRDGRSQIWRDETAAQRIVLAKGITRAEAVNLISQLADWLAWDGSND
jgi:hypothetical protein